MKKNIVIALICGLFFSCEKTTERIIDQKILSSLGNKHKTDWENLAGLYLNQTQEDSTNIDAWLGLAETNIVIYVFGFTAREAMIPTAKSALERVYQLDSTSSEVWKIKAILSFLDWNWEAAEYGFNQSIELDSNNLNARHWYSLYLMAMMRHDEAMDQSDLIMDLDNNNQFNIARGSMLYFERRFEEMKELMIKTAAMDTTVAWSYDWLGMAYIELKEYENSINTYFKAFELSDGTVEVGAGLGHALGQAGETKLAKQMADYYELAAKTDYLPPVQRAFVHIGIKEYDKALELLEQAHEEKSWFLIFIKTEPWYDPIRKDPELNLRFEQIIEKLNYPKG